MRVVGALVVLGVLLGGCARVVPPRHVGRPVVVYLTDYGRHSSVVLPVGEGTGVEYTYGDWKYYALNQWKWYVGVKALFCSEGATLGRRMVDLPGEAEALRRVLRAERVMVLVVEEEKADALRGELEARYAEGVETEIYNEYQRTHFVRDAGSRYGIFNNCNHATARWLERLGCEVMGWAVLSKFRVAGGERETRDKQTMGQGEGVEWGSTVQSPSKMRQKPHPAPLPQYRERERGEEEAWGEGEQIRRVGGGCDFPGLGLDGGEKGFDTPLPGL